MSLVLVSPSTESWSQVRAAAGRSSPHSVAGRDGRVGQDDRQHRGHARMDHPDALGDPADRSPSRAAPSASGSSTVVVATFVTESVVRSASAIGLSPASVAASVGTSALEPGRRPCRAAVACR